MEREHKPDGTRGFSRLEVFEKAATKKDNHNHPNSLQRVNYRIEHIKIKERLVSFSGENESVDKERKF